jgi:hypothetical protein
MPINFTGFLFISFHVRRIIPGRFECRECLFDRRLTRVLYGINGKINPEML